jgi:hypothetical protein
MSYKENGCTFSSTWHQMEGSGQLQDLAALARRNKPLLTSEEKDD